MFIGNKRRERLPVTGGVLGSGVPGSSLVQTFPWMSRAWNFLIARWPSGADGFKIQLELRLSKPVIQRAEVKGNRDFKEKSCREDLHVLAQARLAEFQSGT